MINKLPSFITDKTKRDDLKEKVEVVFAIATIVGFAAGKIKKKKEQNS